MLIREVTIVDSGNSELSPNLTGLNSTKSGRIRFNTAVASNSEVEISIVTSASTYIIDTDKSEISFRVDNGATFPEVSHCG